MLETIILTILLTCLILLVITVIYAATIGETSKEKARLEAYTKGWEARNKDNDSLLEALAANALADGIREGERSALSRMQRVLTDRKYELAALPDRVLLKGPLACEVRNV